MKESVFFLISTVRCRWEGTVRGPDGSTTAHAFWRLLISLFQEGITIQGLRVASMLEKWYLTTIMKNTSQEALHRSIIKTNRSDDFYVHIHLVL